MINMKSIFVIAISSICTTLAAISPQLVEIDEMYSKLLGLPNKKDEATRDFSGGTFVTEFDKNLKMDLDFVLFKQDIAKMLYYAENSLAIKEHKQLFDKKQKNFDEFFGAVQEHSLTGICEIWKFWRNLGDEFAKTGLLPMQAQIYAKTRQFIDAPRRINCSKIEQLFKEDRNVKKAAKEKKGWAQIFLDDLKLLHFNAFKYELVQKYDDSSQKWKFSKLFDAEMMPNETNFAFQLRLLHVEANPDKIRHIKSVIKEHFIDEEMLLRLEMYAPAVFVPEIMDDQTLADKYIKVTTTDQKTRLLDVELSIRIYFGRIWQIFEGFYSLEKGAQKKLENDEFLDRKSTEFFGVSDHNSFTMDFCHKWWHELATLFNSEILSLEENKKIQIKNIDAANTIADRLNEIECHLKNMERLFLTQNAFREHFQNAKKETKFLLKMFLVERFENENDRENTRAFNELMPKFPFLVQVFRNELTDKQIEEKQIENYINFLDSNKSKKVSKIARVIIDMLVYYQWFKTIVDEISLDEHKQLITNYLEAIEIWIETLEDSKSLSPLVEQDIEYFKFLEQGKQSLEGYLQRDDANANLNDKKSAKIPIDGTLEAMHGGTVGRLLSLKSFRDKLKRIEINKKRMNELFDDGAEIVLNLLNLSQKSKKIEPKGKSQKVEPKGKGQIATKSDEPPPPLNSSTDDSEIFAMVFLYQQILIGKEPMNSFSIKLFNTDAVYFLLNDLINDVMNAIRSLNTTKNGKLQRMVSQILKIEKSENFGESPTFVEKIKKSCYMQSFLEWVTNNGTMHSESAPWRKFLDKFVLSKIVKSKIGAPSEADFNWDRPDCEDEKVHTKSDAEMKSVPMIIKIHINLILNLAERAPFFLEFLMQKVDTLPTIQNLTTNCNIQSLYENIFRSSSLEMARSHQTELSLRNAISWIVSLTNEQKKSVQIVLIESFVTLRIIDIFEDNKALSTVRMLCTAVAFINLATNTEKQTKLIWKSPAHCFGENVEADPIYFDQLTILAHWHINFFREYLPKCADDDLLVQIIRETLGSLYTLGMLVGSDEVFNLMSNEQIRPKLINQTLFTDKNRLLAHYNRSLTDQNYTDRLTNRVFADLIVLMEDYFDSNKYGQEENVLKTLMDQWRLYLRFVYESIIAVPETAPKYALLISNLMPEMDKFLITNKNNKKLTNNLEKLRNVWIPKEIAAVAETELQWFEAKKEAAPPEIVQKMHFKQLKKLRFNPEAVKEFTKISEDLKNNKNCRKNLLQLLTIEDTKAFLKMIGVEYGKNEFKNDKNVDNKVDNGVKNKNKINSAENVKNKQRNQNKVNKVWTKIEKAKPSTSKNLNIFEENNNNPNDQNSQIPKIDESKKVEQKNAENASENVEEFALQTPQITEQNQTPMTKTEEKWYKIERKKTDNQKPQQLMPSIYTFSNLCNKSTLLKKYKQSILNYIGQMDKDVLDLCAYENEIDNRIKIISNLSEIENFLVYNLEEKNNGHKLNENWSELKSKLGIMKIKNKNDFQFIRDKLFEILCQILIFQHGNGQPTSFNDSINYQIQNLRKQIHLKNVLLALYEDKELRRKWNNFRVEEKFKKLYYLLQIQMNIIRFEVLMEEVDKMNEQIEIDQELFDAVVTKSEEEKQHYLLPTFPKISQQITIAQPNYVGNYLAKNFDNYLASFVYENLNKKKEYEKKRNEALQKIVTIVDKWSNKQSLLLISGSLLLNAHTIGSDVNLVCITPGEKLKVSDFMGNDKTSKCSKNKCSEDTNASLFCQLCEHESTANLIKIESYSILIIRFSFDCIEFDISLVAIPKVQNLDAQKINDQALANLLNQFNWTNSEHKNMSRTLASYRSTLYIANLFFGEITMSDDDSTKSLMNILEQQQSFSNSNDNSRNFRQLFMAIKFWSKNNFIYSNKMGFLNGMALSIMVAKIVLLYPNASLQFLLEKFFLIYSTRPHQIPIQLTKIEQKNSFPDALNALNPKELEMPVFTPTFCPLQNATRFVTHSNAKVIRRQMAQALSKINSMKNRPFNLDAFLNVAIPFTERYANFFVINCMAEEKELADSFCGFVEWRMRLQIIFDIDKKGGSIETHLNPNVYRETCDLPSKLVQMTVFRPIFCKVWLLAIVNDSVMPEQLNVMANQFDVTIKKQFINMKHKEILAPKLALKSILMKREKLLELDGA